MRIPILRKSDMARIGSLPWYGNENWRAGDVMRFRCYLETNVLANPQLSPEIEIKAKEFPLTQMRDRWNSWFVIVTNQPVEYFLDIVGFKEIS